MFSFGGRKRFESKVNILIRDIDHYGHLGPHAASSRTSSQLRASGCSEHETALALCLTKVIALLEAGRTIEANNLLARAEETASTWVEARVVRLQLANDFFKNVETATGHGVRWPS